MKESSTYKKWQITPVQADFGITLLLDKNSDPIQKDCLLVCVKSIKKSYPDLPIAVITDQSIKETNLKEEIDSVDSSKNSPALKSLSILNTLA